MKTKPIKAAGAALALAISQAAALAVPVQSTTAAPAAPSETSADDITVTGQKLTPKEYREKIQTFVRDTGVAAGTRPVARWIQPVCFRALGLAEDQAERVETLFRKVAADARVPVARQPCNTNAVVSFTDDGKKVVKSIQKRSALRMAEIQPSAREALLKGEAPVRWWYTTDRLSRFGTSRGSSSPTTTLDGIGNLPGGDVPTIQHYSSSVVSTQVVRSLETATVVVDISKAPGVPLDTLASYAALVAFAEINARDAAPEGSILSALEPGGPRELTEIDMAFLRTLYRLPLDREALAQRGLLVDGMINRQE